jgi:phosphoribosylformylglycinamidine synthase subunit PurQ / glutaminase
MKALPKIIVLAGYGLNCEEETARAFEIAGGQADIVHINDLVADKNKLLRYQILAIPGGFSYGDDTGSGRAYANKLKNHLKAQLIEFSSKDKLMIGICNGFQILTHVGLLPGALTFNDNNRYTDRWVDLKMPKATFDTNPWLKGIKYFSLPIAHGEGKFYAGDDTLKQLKKQNQLSAVYYKGETCGYQDLTPNPNGSLLDIAMITSENGKILGTMPHPERAMFFTQLPHWPLLKEKLVRAGKPLPKYGPGLQIFKNAVNYFK